MQAFITLAFIASFGGQVVVAMMLMKLPLFLWRRFQLEMTATALILTLVTGRAQRGEGMCCYLVI